MTQSIDNIPLEEETAKQIEYLREFMLPERFETLSRKLDMRTTYMVLCLEDIYYSHNASATIRSAEAFGLQQMHVVANKCDFAPSRDIVRGTDQWIEIMQWNTTEKLVLHLRSLGYRIVVTEPSEGGSTLESFDVAVSPFAVFLGTEKSGISKWLRTIADDTIYIPMSGFAESLNVSVSSAIITQRLTDKIRQTPKKKWQIHYMQKQKILLKWLKYSIKDSDRILERR